MGLPGHRRTSSDKRRRAAHFGLVEKSMGKCPECQKAVRPHHACASCGAYKGKQVVNTTKRLARSSRKTKKS